MSYVRRDDEHENGRLTTLRERLESEVRMQTGLDFPIFQDRNDIAWGDNWKTRIEEGIDAVTFFIPIVTPGFFQSSACRDEFERFRKRETSRDRSDLILPIYYVETDEFSDESARGADAMARELLERQYFDWRPLRFEPFTSARVGKAFVSMAKQIKAAFPNASSRPAQRTRASRKTERMGASELFAVEQSRRAPVPQSEPPTFVVDAMHRGDYPTLTEAIEAVPPGARLLVRPGYYSEGIVMDKPLEILGEGPRDEIIVAARGCDTLLFQTTMGRVANLTLRQEGEGDYSAVDVTQGRLHLEDCDVSSRSLACVAVHHGADPVVRGNRIHDGKGSGVHVYEYGRGTFEDNDIFANAVAGFFVIGGGDPVVRGNRIHDGKQIGVMVWEEGRGTFEDNDVFANAHVGFFVGEGGDPVVRGNRIRENRHKGIWIYKNGKGTYEQNHIWSNSRGPWNIAEAAGDIVRRDNTEGPPDGEG